MPAGTTEPISLVEEIQRTDFLVKSLAKGLGIPEPTPSVVSAQSAPPLSILGRLIERAFELDRTNDYLEHISQVVYELMAGLERQVSGEPPPETKGMPYAEAPIYTPR